MKHDLKLTDKTERAPLTVWYFRALVIAALALFPCMMQLTGNTELVWRYSALQAISIIWVAAWALFTVLTVIKNDITAARSTAVWWGFALAAFLMFIGVLEGISFVPQQYLGILMTLASVVAAPVLLASSIVPSGGFAPCVIASLVIFSINFIIILVNRYKQRRLD